ncbi:MAG: MBL fold metallo-hydrolase [Oscillospiraceae bacterium]|jgi:glyoxylase-like metal-dependent hydrolase (beta-lactamase superfamily II)|nr:MBL fold metallo-hydrolase [Oscillospiraceae bacterium]
MLKFKVKEIQKGLFMLTDPLEVNLFLIVGEEKALLFDTGYGFVNTPTAIKEITDKPVTVVLGHGHLDHANGAYQFDEVYLREPDFDLCREHTGSKFRKMLVDRLEETGQKLDVDPETWINSGACNLIPLEAGTIFDLGGLHVEVIDMAGHTGGSIGLLIKEMRILLDSDSANSHCWMFMPQSLGINEYISMLERVKKLDFDTFYTAHQDFPHDKSFFDKYISVAKNVTMENSTPYGNDNWKELEPRVYSEGDISIVINERVISMV